jgi:4-hydroxy-tetrahydrodipicolinate reductase
MGRLVVDVLTGRTDAVLCATPGRGSSNLADADVVVDFSTPDALVALLPHLSGRALVTGTTGLTDAHRAALAVAATTSAVLHAPNFSTGVAVLKRLVAAAGAALPGWDVEIVEMHHTAKRDAPSGTALALREAVRPGARAASGRHGPHEGDVGLHAVRLGDVVGEHDVYLAGPGERLRLGHVASSRRAFAEGAVRAALWLAGRPPGACTFDDVLTA